MQFSTLALFTVFASVSLANSVERNASIKGGVVGNFNDATMKYINEVIANTPAKSSVDGRGERPIQRRSSSTGDCSVAKAQCCNQHINDESTKKTIANLAGLNDIVGSIALQCSQLPVGILPIAAQNTCKSAPVCCNNVTQDGLVNFGCISLPIN